MSEQISIALKRVAALVVLGVAAWVLLKLVLNVVAAVAWATVGLLLVIAAAWALFTLRRSQP